VGFVKDQLIERDERGYGWIGNGVFVCEACLADADLRSFVRDHLDGDIGNTRCSYCDRIEDRVIAIPVDAVLEEIADALFTEYEQADASLFDSETGDWLMPTFDTGELFAYELGEYPFHNERLADDIMGAFAVDPWSERDPLWLDPGEALVAGWEGFAYQVKHVTRYLYFPPEATPFEDAVPPGQILTKIGEFAEEHDLFAQLEAGTHLFRARHRLDMSVLTTVEDLGAPTAEQATTSSRMSAAGIPVFYGSLEKETAIEETLAHVSTGGGGTREVQVSWGSFWTTRAMRVLDLRRVPSISGLFGAGRHQRPTIRFLRTFAAEVGKPIPIGGQEHVEYAPTQVVAEFFRHANATPDGERLDGINYPSAVRDAGSSCVLFFSGDNCGLPGLQGRIGQRIEMTLDPASLGSVRCTSRWEQATEPSLMPPGDRVTPSSRAALTGGSERL
jgi:hypothetical protein